MPKGYIKTHYHAARAFKLHVAYVFVTNPVTTKRQWLSVGYLCGFCGLVTNDQTEQLRSYLAIRKLKPRGRTSSKC